MSRFIPKTSKFAPQENFKSLLLLRVFGMLGQLVAVLLAIYHVQLSVPIEPLLSLLLVNAIWSAASYVIFKRQEKLSENSFFIQLVFDILMLTALLYFTGGATNPFAWLLLVPHTIASTILSRRYAWLMAVIASLAYTIIVYFYVPLMHMGHPMEMGMGGHFEEHIIGMWLGFVLSAFLMAHFVAGMADALRKRNQILNELKEKMYRDERLVALGTLATGAAHELGTPLGTMDIIAHELEQQFKTTEQKPIKDKLVLIQKQIKRCKESLANITKTASYERLDAGQIMDVDDYIKVLVTQWQVSHSSVDFQQEWEGAGVVPKIVSDATLSHAIINILDNAAQSSTEQVKLRVNWDNKYLHIIVRDDGPGMSDELLEKLGLSEQPSTQAGLGLGTYIAKASVERLGGFIEWKNNNEQGLDVLIRVPIYGGGI
jgi:two-component system sensor histidine kinase RegB